MAVFPFFGYVRADEDWTRTATVSGSSEQLGYEAIRAQNDDPTDNWWATSGSGTLTLSWGAPVEVGVIAIIMSNVDQGRTVTIGGGISTALAGARGLNGYPRNLMYMPPAPVMASSITVSVAGNSSNLSIGTVRVGRLRLLHAPIQPGSKRTHFGGVDVDAYEEFHHDIVYNVGGQGFEISAGSMQVDQGLQELLDIWEASDYGAKGMVIVPSDSEQPRLVRCQKNMAYTTQGWRGFELTFREIGRGILVV
jgi:hypothetical protein